MLKIENHPLYRKLVEDFKAVRGRPPNELDKLSLHQDFEIEMIIQIQSRLNRIEDNLAKLMGY